MSSFGTWTTDHGLPAFRYTASAGETSWDPILDPPTSRHWVHLGNRRVTLVADNEGLSGLWDEHTGQRWLTEPRPHGTGISRLDDHCSSDQVDSTILFGSTYSRVRVDTDEAGLERTVMCPEGDHPWVLVRVVVTNHVRKPVSWTLHEEWDVRQRLVDLEFGPRTDPDHASAVSDEDAPWLVLEKVGGQRVTAKAGLLNLAVTVTLKPHATETFWFRFGLETTSGGEPASLYAASLVALDRRLPRAESSAAPEVAREIPWHAALLTGGACADGVLGGHTLNQGSAYAFRHGFNGAARDPLQHALPLIYTEPDLALSVLRNTCSWTDVDGELPYALDGRKVPRMELFRPSDQNLWALWLASEYAAVTGDLAAFAEPIGFHPQYAAEPVTLQEHLRRQFRYFTDVIGTGAHGHVRIRNADWNDLVLDEVSDDRDGMIERGESVLNSAMAAWVLPRYAALAERLGDLATAEEARVDSHLLRDLVATEWTGRWFRRAYGPTGTPIGDDALWLETQPWAILCGAAGDDRAEDLLRTIDQLCRADSPLGARLQWPPPAGDRGDIWPSINTTLIWAAARLDPDLAWNEFRRMTLAAHSNAYPGIWEGTLSGPDAYLAPESDRPGQTSNLAELGVSMQAWPVANLHSHAQPLLSYLRLLGVEPTESGDLRTGGGGHFESRVLTLRPDGSGTLNPIGGPVTIHPATGAPVQGGGPLTWSSQRH